MDVTVHWDVLLLVLFSGIAAKLLHRVSGRCSQWVLEMTLPEPPSLAQLRTDIVQLKEELQGINMTEHFADYARLKRKINRKETELGNQGAAYRNDKWKRKTITEGVCFFLIEASRIGIILFNRQTPVLLMPPEWSWPLARVLSFPTGIPGALGTPVWALLCRQFIETCTILF